MIAELPQHERIVITGVGLTAPNGNNLAEFRQNLLAGTSGITPYDIRYVGATLAGVCHFDESRYQKKKDLRRGTRAGSVAIYCAHEAIADAGLDWPNVDKSNVGIYLGVTEHGNVETENEIYELRGYDYDTKFWSHHHNPRTVANNPAGEVSLNLGITGPHYTVGAACAAGNAGLIQGRRCCGWANATWRSPAAFPRACAPSASSPASKARGAGHARGSDPGFAPVRRRAQRHRSGRRGRLVHPRTAVRRPAARRPNLRRTGRLRHEQRRQRLRAPQSPAAGRMHPLGAQARRPAPEQVDIVSTHATGTTSGDVQECAALRRVFGESKNTSFNNTKSFIGHAMGAAGALELGGNLPAFDDGVCHHTINVDELDPECSLDGLVTDEPRQRKRVDVILNNSFGMLGINSVVIIKRF